MNFSPYFYAEIRGGRLFFKNRPQFDKWIFTQSEGQYQLSVEPKFEVRTTGQPWEDSNWNGYYWAVIVNMLCEPMGITLPLNCHHRLKIMFNPKGYTYKDKDGVIQNAIRGGSTTKFSKKRMREYCMEIRRWAMDPVDGLSFYIPEPHESPEAMQSLIDAHKDYSPA